MIRRRLLTSLVVAFAWCAHPAAQPAPSVAGTWSGAIDVPGAALGIVVRLQVTEAGQWSGTIDIPQQNAKAVPLAAIAVQPPDVSFQIPGAPGAPTIRGTLSADGTRMTGTLTQGGGSVPVSLTRGEPVPPRRPQLPMPPFPYDQEDVSYRNDVAGIRIAGTMTRPRDAGPFAAVLLLTGSGAQDRDETIAGHKPFLVLADYLTRQGIAVLRVDDRGVGGTERGQPGPTSEDFAGDARAGVAYLRSRKDIDPRRIGLIGHSEGALLAAMAAASSADVAFIVMLAGPGVSGIEIVKGQAERLLRISGADEATVAWDQSVRTRVYDVLRAETNGRPDAARRQALLEQLSTEKAPPGIAAGSPPRAMGEGLLKAGSDPWFRFFLSYDPRIPLAKVRVPVLALFGERDVQVPHEQNLREVEQTLRNAGNKDVTVMMLPGLNHLFQTSITGMPAEYGTIEETFAPAALKVVGDWIRARTSSTGVR